MKLHEWQAEQRATAAPRFVPDAERQCEGKVSHFSRADAIAALEKLREQGKVTGMLSTYRCLLCAGWHVGHTPKVGIPIIVAWVWEPWWNASGEVVRIMTAHERSVVAKRLLKLSR